MLSEHNLKIVHSTLVRLRILYHVCRITFIKQVVKNEFLNDYL